MSAPTWLKPTEVAQLLRVTPQTVYRMVDSRELPAIRFGGPAKNGTIRIPATAVAEFLTASWVGEIPEGYRLTDLLGEHAETPAEVVQLHGRGAE